MALRSGLHGIGLLASIGDDTADLALKELLSATPWLVSQHAEVAIIAACLDVRDAVRSSKMTGDGSYSRRLLLRGLRAVAEILPHPAFESLKRRASDLVQEASEFDELLFVCNSCVAIVQAIVLERTGLLSLTCQQFRLPLSSTYPFFDIS